MKKEDKSGTACTKTVTLIFTSEASGIYPNTIHLLLPLDQNSADFPLNHNIMKCCLRNCIFC